MQLAQTVEIDHILIIDNNSSDGTYDYLYSEGIIALPNVCYYNIGENTGGAGGFEFGIKKALEIDDDIICLMDDDGRPFDEKCFEAALKTIPYQTPNDSIPIFINSLVQKDEVFISFPLEGKIRLVNDAIKMSNDGFLKGYSSPFNGTFINKDLVDIIGLPRGEFFIRFDEVDYYYKARDCGSFMGVAVNSHYYHPSTPEYEEKRFLGLVFRNGYEAPWKEYYKMRNLTVLERERGKTAFKSYISCKIYLFGLLLFKFKDRKTLKRFIKQGYIDANKHKMGRTILPGQLEITK